MADPSPSERPTPGGSRFAWREVCGSRAAVMGVVNVTPDSFSDGGRYLDGAAAVAHGLELVAAGAGVLDVGGESTRPGADPVPEAEELRRVVPVVERLAAESGVPVSIDTTKASVASAALAAGARIVNDVSAGRADPEILAVTARAGAGYLAMHMLGEPRTMQDSPRYVDVVAEVGDFLVERLAVARAAGIPTAALAADPGIGFGKTVAHNLELLARLPALVAARRRAGRDRHVAQVVPRPRAGRRGRRDRSATGRSARRGDAGDDCLGDRPRRARGAGPRRRIRSAGDPAARRDGGQRGVSTGYAR